MTAHQLIALLQAANIHFTLSSVREEAVMFHIAVPGERWEAEVFADGHVELERFIVHSDLAGEAALLSLINQFKD